MVLVCELWKLFFVKTKYKEDPRHNKINANVGERESGRGSNVSFNAENSKEGGKKHEIYEKKKEKKKVVFSFPSVVLPFHSLA